jgi:hypothetical protein
MSDNGTLIAAVEKNLNKLGEDFLAYHNDYFFTEKELHSYFYHLCISDKAFHYEKLLLLHTEYPSPFKFSYTGDGIKQEAATAKNTRGHIDCVVVNPHFIDWLSKGQKEQDKKGLKALYGIGSGLFGSYITGLYKTYQEFNEATGEAILLYALEFKFLRHSYGGIKYPIKDIKRDLAKLATIRRFKVGSDCEITFVSKTKVIIMIGERVSAGDKIAKELEEAYKLEEEYLLFDKGGVSRSTI